VEEDIERAWVGIGEDLSTGEHCTWGTEVFIQ